MRRVAQISQVSFLLNHAITQRGAAIGQGQHVQVLERDRLGAEVIKRAQAAAEQHGHENDVHFVGEARLENLLRDVGATADDADVFGGAGPERLG